MVSCEPTVVILGSQYWPGRIPATLHALPTIFCASVKPLSDTSVTAGTLNTSVAPKPSDVRALSVSPRPMISGIRPPARTSSRMTSDLSVNVEITSSVP